MPFVDGKTLTGWGVFKSDPWHFAGIFSSKEEAEAEAKARGDGYAVRYGDNKEGTDDFLWDITSTPNADRT